MYMKMKKSKSLQNFTANARKGVRNRIKVKVGFFDNARYQDGEYVATVAAKNEFGYPGVPSRPFFRRALHTMQRPLVRHLAVTVNPKTMIVSPRVARQCGLIMETAVRDSITHGNWKPNSPMTIRMKGSSKPLIDTGFMRASVASRVED